MAFDLTSVEASQERGCDKQVNLATGTHKHKSKDIVTSLESRFVDYVIEVDN